MKELIAHIEIHISNLLTGQLPVGMVFHNLRHTRQMVSAVKELAENLLINEWDSHVLQIAAWFHDSGYCYTYHGHEAISMTLAGDYLREHGQRQGLIQGVNNCIRATKMPQLPQSTLQSIMCDADMWHLSVPDYQEHVNLLREEWFNQLGKTFSESEWNLLNIKFMSKHNYFTAHARNLWEPGKLNNTMQLRKILLDSGANELNDEY